MTIAQGFCPMVKGGRRARPVSDRDMKLKHKKTKYGKRTKSENEDRTLKSEVHSIRVYRS